jgi:hypothetical protein
VPDSTIVAAATTSILVNMSSSLIDSFTKAQRFYWSYVPRPIMPI